MLKLHRKLAFLYTDNIRYKCAHGGRNGAKSHNFATAALMRAYEKKTKILCLREYQKNLKESVHALLQDKISQDKQLKSMFTIQRDLIYGKNGTEILFSGIKNAVNIKSFEGADIAWVEEAQTLSEESLQILIPTIRKDDSQIWFSFNPKARTDPVYKFCVESNDPDMKTVQINYIENPLCPKIMIREAEKMKAANFALYEHIWLGKPLDISEDVIFKGRFVVQELPIEYYGNKPYYNSQYLGVRYGLDFGFSVDPAAIPEIFIIDEQTIYINREIYEIGLLPSKYIERIKEKMPEAILTRSKFWCDAARPDSIAQLKHDGLNCDAAPKTKGSVEAGIEYLLGLKIIVNPSCTNTIYELHNYKYKTDKLTGEITSDIIDANNHIMDAIRYALWENIQSAKRQFIFTEADITELERL